MSIIYRALKKLQSEREPEESGPAVSPPQNAEGSTSDDSSSRKRILILLGALIFMVLLSAAGLKLVEIASEEPTPPPRPKRALPARPVAANSPAPAPQPAAPNASAPVIASVHKPQAEIPEPAGGPESGDTPETIAATDGAVATPVTMLPATKSDKGAPPADAVAQKELAAPKTASKPALVSEPGGGLPVAEYDSPEPLIIDDPLSSDPAGDPEYGKYQRNSKKQAEAALAAARLQQAIRSNDEAGVERALEQLARLKGRDSAYFLQMQAYWYLHAKRYDAAERTLIRVLHKNPNSLHAGLNMAVLESLTGREAAARDRLQALAERFPDNPEVKALQRRLD